MENKKYHVIIDKLINFQENKHRNAHDNFLMPNVLVNEINDIGVKTIDDGEDA